MCGFVSLFKMVQTGCDTQCQFIASLRVLLELQEKGKTEHHIGKNGGDYLLERLGLMVYKVLRGLLKMKMHCRK